MSTVKEWRETRLKNLFTSVRNGVWGTDPDDETEVFCARGTDFDRTANRISVAKMPRRSVPVGALRDHQLQHGDLVLEKSGGSADQPVGSVALFDLEIHAVCSNFNARMQVSRDVDPPFACYLMNSLYWSGFTRQFVQQTTGIQNLDAQALLAQHCTLPPLDEQRRIADFLDAETARIDKLSESRSKQLDMITEHGAAELHNTIRGATLGSPMHHSGLDWLGNIAEDFRTAAVSHEFEVALGKMLSPERVQGGHLRPYLRNTNVQWDDIDTDDLLFMNFPPDEQIRYQVHPGDLLVCEGGDPGRAAIWNGSIKEIYYQKALHRVRPCGESTVRWLYYCLRAATYLNVFAVQGNSTTIAHLTGEQLKAQRFPFPSRAIQDQLVKILDERTEHRRNVEAAIDRQLALLAERRQALITAAVTGQIDVTTARGVSSSGGVAV